jgi:SAM-dependent methyltransferase
VSTLAPRHVDLLRAPRIRRPIGERAAAAARTREIARRFGREYFDGDRTEGYGGYRYDGRWVAVAERIRDVYGVRAGQHVLDIGCAKGFLLHDLRTVIPGVAVAGLDVSSYALQHVPASVRPHVVQGTAEALPFADASFDLVLSINVVHNLPMAACRRALQEMERVSRGGKFVQVDSYLDDEQRADLERWILTAVTYFDPDGWLRVFREAGYTGDYAWTITE